jgi:oligopeptide/dipeptide ABC transporter ATP-binding protein
LYSIPDIDTQRGTKLKAIKGVVPSPDEIKRGCRFKTRCEYVKGDCLDTEPPLIEVESSFVRCWNYK